MASCEGEGGEGGCYGKEGRRRRVWRGLGGRGRGGMGRERRGREGMERSFIDSQSIHFEGKGERRTVTVIAM